MKRLVLVLLLTMGGSLSAQEVLFICTAQLPCPGFPLGSVQAGVDQNGWRHFKLTLTQNVTQFSFVGTPPPAQAAVTVIFTQDAIGSRTVTFAANITSPCSITGTANSTTTCQFEFDGTAGLWIGISGSATAALPGASASGQTLLSTKTGSTFIATALPTTLEAYLTWQPPTLYPAIISGTCVFAAGSTCSISYGTTFSSAPLVQFTPVNPGAVTFTLTSESTTGFTLTASGSNSLTVNYDATTPQGTNCVTNTFVLAGAKQNLDFIAPIWGTALPANLDALMRISGSDLIEVRLCNPTTSAITFSTSINFGARLVR